MKQLLFHFRNQTIRDQMLPRGDISSQPVAQNLAMDYLRISRGGSPIFSAFLVLSQLHTYKIGLYQAPFQEEDALNWLLWVECLSFNMGMEFGNQLNE